MKTKTNLVLLIIVIFGSLLRLFWLQKSPPSLNWDEAALGYNAYSLLKTAKDEYGFSLPLSFRSFDDYKPPLYSYVTVPFIATFGLNATAVRLPSALAGISIILVIYLISSTLFNKYTGLLSCLFITIEPWAVHFSRAAFETNLGLSFLLWSVYFSLKMQKNVKYFYLSTLLLYLSAFTYHSYRVLLIPMIIFTFYSNRKLFKEKLKTTRVLIFLSILTIPLIFILKSGGGLVRLEATSIFRAVNFEDSNTPAKLLQETFILGKNIVGRYFAYFSPANLFVRGTNEPNQKIFGFGMFYTIEFIFYLLGFYTLIKNARKNTRIIALIAVAPLPAIITWNWFLPARVLFLFSIFSIVIGLGAFRLYESLNRKRVYFYLSIIAFSIILLNNISNLLTTLLFYMPYSERGNWQYGFEQIMDYVAPISDNYNQIIFETGHAQPHIFVLFYSGYDPARYHSDIVCPECVEKPRKNFDFGKYKFRKIYWPDDRSGDNTLFIGSEYSLPENDIINTPNARILADVKDDHGDFLARIVELK